MGFRVEAVQSTPNPNAAKFVLDKEITGQPTSFFSASAAVDHPLAKKLFQISGVSGVLLLGDFVTINKSSKAKWADIQEKVTQVLASVEVGP